MSEKSQIQLRVSQPSAGNLVSELLSRQDSVLLELEQLNERIESVIKSINDARQVDVSDDSDSPQVKAA